MMRNQATSHGGVLGLVVLALAAGGCAVSLAKRSPWDIQRLAQLSEELEHFKTLSHLKEEEANELRRAKEMLDSQFSSSQASVGYDERGVVTRFVDQVLFDSGRAQLRPGAKPALDRVAKVILDVERQPVGIEGHTDDQPIKRSTWASNKELSIARASAVADYLADHHGIDRSRMTVIGYGDERPIAENDTPRGRQQNRRVEVVILPRSLEGSYHNEAQRESKGMQGFFKK